MAAIVMLVLVFTPFRHQHARGGKTLITRELQPVFFKCEGAFCLETLAPFTFLFFFAVGIVRVSQTA